jgi:hypothetical protein
MELTSFVWGIFATIITLGLVGVVWIGLSLIKRTKHLEDLTKSLQIDFYERLEEMPAINSLKKSMRREEVYHLDLDGFKDRINEIEDALSDLQQFNRILDNRLTFIQETMNGTQDQIDSIRRDMRLTPNPLPGNPGFSYLCSMQKYMDKQ